MKMNIILKSDPKYGFPQYMIRLTSDRDIHDQVDEYFNQSGFERVQLPNVLILVLCLKPKLIPKEITVIWDTHYSLFSTVLDSFYGLKAESTQLSSIEITSWNDDPLILFYVQKQFHQEELKYQIKSIEKEINELEEEKQRIHNIKKSLRKVQY